MGANKPGLGAHLYQALGGQTAVVGVAKTRFRGAETAYEVVRGRSTRPLFITAAGIDPERAAKYDTAPQRDISLPWPIDELASVSAFMGPLSAGPIVGALARDWRVAAVGLLVGICVMRVSPANTPQTSKPSPAPVSLVWAPNEPGDSCY